MYAKTITQGGTVLQNLEKNDPISIAIIFHNKKKVLTQITTRN